MLFLLVFAPAGASTSLMYRSADVEKTESAAEVVSTGEVSDTVPAEETKKLRTPVFAMKNNLLYDAMLTPNLTFEVKLAKRWTLQVEGGFNPFPLDDTKDHKWRHFLVDLEAKYWFCEAFHRDFIGVNVAYSHYNVAKGAYPIGWLYPAVKDNRFQGDAVMAGVSYGWSFPVSKHVAFELEAGVDAGYTWYGKYECPHCGALLAQERKWFAVPKAGVNISILLPAEEREDCPCKYQKEEELPEKEENDGAPIETKPEAVSHGESGQPQVPNAAEQQSLHEGAASDVPVVPVVVPAVPAYERLHSPILASYSEYKPYSTSDVLVESMTFNKFTLNQYLKGFGVSVSESLVVRKGNEDLVTDAEITEHIGLPCFVKPNAGGSSFGVTKVKTLEQLRPAIRLAMEESDEVMVEAFMPGTELTCGCYKTAAGEHVFPVTEVVTHNEFFDYDAKYNGSVDEITPARISDDLRDRVQALTSAIYDILGCSGIIRIDYIVTKVTGEDGHERDRINMLEINTTPGMTATSFIPQQVRAAGLDIKDVLTDIIEDKL